MPSLAAISEIIRPEVRTPWPPEPANIISFIVEEATEDALYETAGTIAEICENNGAVGSVIAEDSKQQRKHESAVYTACTWYHEEHQESL